MSDVSQGPDWWQASDGKWYAPEPQMGSAPAGPQYCTNCGQTVDPAAPVCSSCGVPQMTQSNFCWNCSSGLQPNQVMCTTCGVGLVPAGSRAGQAGQDNKKILAGILGILFGAWGVHKFVLGYTNEGLITLGISIVGGIVTLGIATVVMAIIGIVEGIMYLTKPDEEFYQTYQIGHKGWF